MHSKGHLAGKHQSQMMQMQHRLSAGGRAHCSPGVGPLGVRLWELPFSGTQGGCQRGVPVPSKQDITSSAAHLSLLFTWGARSITAAQTLATCSREAVSILKASSWSYDVHSTRM